MSKKKRKIEEGATRTILLKDLTDGEVGLLKEFAEGLDWSRTVREIGEKFEAAARKDGDPADFSCTRDSGKPFKQAAEMDEQVNPKHYKSGCGIECGELMRERLGDDNYFGFCLCNAFKYLFRCRHKNPTASGDVRKAHWYLAKAVEIIDKEERYARQENTGEGARQ